MRKNHRPYWLIKLSKLWQNWLVEKKIRPQFAQLGLYPSVLHPNTLEIFGNYIVAGDYLHLISNPHQPIKLSTWNSKQQQGKITIGDYCLISPGVTISAAENILIGNNCMIAANVNISDCDWHGIYNRLRPFRCTQPITIKENVWIGLNAIIGKGVTIGENSIIGAGSVVVDTIPANVIAAGNPARVVREMNPRRKMLKREFLFKHGQEYWRNQNDIEKYFCQQNSTLHWLTTLIAPGPQD